MNLLIRAPPWQMTYLEANYLWGPGGRGINLIKVWKHNKTNGSSSMSRCPIQMPRTSLICWRYLPLGAATYSYPTSMAPIAADLAEATHTSFVLSPSLLMRPIHLSQGENHECFCHMRFTVDPNKTKHRLAAHPLSLMTWFIRIREIT